MKILGTTDKGFVVELSTDEFNNLLGFSSSYDTDYWATMVRLGLAKWRGSFGGGHDFIIGAQVDTAKMFKALQEVRYKAKALDEAQKSLEGLCQALKLIVPDIHNLIDPKKKKGQ